MLENMEKENTTHSKYKRDGRYSTYGADVKPNARRLKSQSPKSTWRESARLNLLYGRESKICSLGDVEKAKKIAYERN